MMPTEGVAMRRMPVYFLIDCSAALEGSAQEAVRGMLTTLSQHIVSDPQSRETVYLSIIAFADTARQYPLLPIDTFAVPDMAQGTDRALGAAFHVLLESLQHDLIPTTAGQRGDQRPLVFVLLGGQPTDAYQDELRQVRNLTGRQLPRLVAVGRDGSVSAALLHEIATQAYLLEHLTPEAFAQLLRVASSAIITASRGVAGTIPPPEWLKEDLLKRT
jgi:uncharacterized protein YegL